MSPKPRLLELVLDAYREGDLHECIRLVRTLVEAAPQATAPRQLLAALFAGTGNGRLALAQYRRLLPQAVSRGEVIRAIAFQKQIDVYEPHESLPPGRWVALQRQLRERGQTFVTDAPGASERPWSEAQLLALPRAWFERIAAETRFEILGLEQRAIEVEAGTVWEVLAGRLRWSFALADGRSSAEALAAEGDAVHVDPGLAREARVSFVPELPVEALRFEAALARDLRQALSAGLHVAGAPVPGLTPETRALLPTRPRRREDLDETVGIPTADPGAGPARLPDPPEGSERTTPVDGDGAGWVDFGVLSLGGPTPADAGRDGTPAAAGTDAGIPAGDVASDPAGSDVADRDGVGSAAAPPPVPSDAAVDPAPAVPAADAGPAEPAEADEAPVRAAGSASIAGSIGEADVTVERRRHPRVTVSFASRVALLRLAGSGLAPVEGQVGDLSTSGFSVRFANRILGASRGALTDAVVAVDMEIPGPQGPLRVAAQVRWLDADEVRDEARIGIEFVLLTETDRRRLAGTLARAALAAREQERKAA